MIGSVSVAAQERSRVVPSGRGVVIKGSGGVVDVGNYVVAGEEERWFSGLM